MVELPPDLLPPGLLPAVLRGAAILLLLSLGLGLLRVLRGPSRADRIVGVQLLGTTGIGILLLLEASGDGAGGGVVALVLALLAALVAVAFVKAGSRDGDSEPEAAEDAAGAVAEAERLRAAPGAGEG